MGTYKKILALSFMIIMVTAGSMIINSCTHQPFVLPSNLRTSDPGICFERDVLPIFQSNCAKSGCHDEHSHKGGYTLDNYNNIVKKGITPGNPAASKIWESISMRTYDDDFMPIGAPALNTSQLDVIKRWISAGAVDSGACNFTPCDTANFTYSGAIAPMMQLYCTGCHSSPSALGGSLMDYNSVKLAAVNGRLIGDIAHTTGYNAMPKGGTTLDDCQVTQVKKWVAAGAQNN